MIRLPFWVISLLLGITQTIGYGTIYYAFGVLAPAMAADTGFSVPAVYGFYSLAMGAGALVAPKAGRLMDRVNPALVMAGGSALCAILMAGWALVPGKAAFVALLVLLELASVMVLYEAAFVTVAHVAGTARSRRVITGITFVAGFASTVFWPLTQYLSASMDWRGIMLAYAVLHVVAAMPLHLALSKVQAAPDEEAVDASTPLAGASVAGKLDRHSGQGRLLFWLMLSGFSAISFVISAVHLHLIGLLGAIGLGTSAALIGAWVGPAQVAARVMEFSLAKRTSIHFPSIISAAALPLAIAVLLAGAPAVTFGLAFAVIFGIGQGLAFVVRGVLPLQAFGRPGYGATMGRINSFRLFFSATAPFVVSLVMAGSGAVPAFLLIAAVGSAGAVCLTAVAVVMGRAKAAS